MEPAVQPFRDGLAEVAMEPPDGPVFSSVYADLFGSTADRIRDQLAAALISPVRWRETLDAMHAIGVRRFVDSGPGKTLAGMVRRAYDDVDAEVLGEREAAHA
jgi:malonyl CoA-acyl carrier protein transacylase